MEDEVNFVNYIFHMLSWSNDTQTAFLFQFVIPLQWKAAMEEEKFSNMLFSSYDAMKFRTHFILLPYASPPKTLKTWGLTSMAYH